MSIPLVKNICPVLFSEVQQHSTITSNNSALLCVQQLWTTLVFSTQIDSCVDIEVIFAPNKLFHMLPIEQVLRYYENKNGSEIVVILKG